MTKKQLASLWGVLLLLLAINIVTLVLVLKDHDALIKTRQIVTGADYEAGQAHDEAEQAHERADAAATHLGE
jgi:hypothetical protein